MLSSAATAARSAAVCTDRSVPLGKYWRSNPLVRLCRGVVGEGAAGAQGAVQFTAQPAASLHVDRLIDGLGHQMPLRLVREAVAQLVADLLGTPPPVQ